MPRAIESCQSNSGLCLRWDFQWEMTCFHHDTRTTALWISADSCMLTWFATLWIRLMPVITDLIRYCSGAHIIYISRHCAMFSSWTCICEHVCVRRRIYTSRCTPQLHVHLLPWEYSYVPISTICFIHANMCVPACTTTFGGKATIFTHER